MHSSNTLFSHGRDVLNTIADAPNPKPAHSDKKGFGSLASLYTAFSKDFGSFAIEKMRDFGHKRILDPFAGMGTLGEAGRSFDIELELNDLNPFAFLACKVRTAGKDVCLEALKILNAAVKIESIADPEPYKNVCLNLLAMSKKETKDIFAAEQTEEDTYIALAIFIVCIARIKRYKSKTGTNPTWTRKISEIDIPPELFIATLEEAKSLFIEYSDKLPERHRKFSIKVSRADVKHICPPDKYDAIITSPPYPNRIDYYKHYLPATALLAELLGLNERSLRLSQIGTPLIREIDEIKKLSPNTDRLIETIKSHDSYASNSYYWKGFYYYFSDMSSFFGRAWKTLSPGGNLIFVVQDTFYKDVPVPVSDLLSELAIIHGFSVVDDVRWEVPVRLSTMSPHVKYRRARKPREVAVLLSK